MKLLLFSLLLFIPTSLVFAENIVYNNALPAWFEYDCTESLPSTWTEADPNANKWKYFSFVYENHCYANMQTFDLSEISAIENMTSTIYYIDSNGVLIDDRTLSDDYEVSCDLLYFGVYNNSNGVISQTPSSLSTFSCSGSPPLGEVQEIISTFTSTQYNNLQSEITAGNTTLGFMIFPHFNSTMLSDLDSNDYSFGVESHKNDLSITGDGFVCFVISASNMCNFLNEPWDAVGKALGSEYIGDWFYVIVFFPIPMSVFLVSRNGTYAGFVGLGIMLVIETIDRTVFEIAFSMILISAGFAFSDILRKRIFD